MSVITEEDDVGHPAVREQRKHEVSAISLEDEEESDDESPDNEEPADDF